MLWTAASASNASSLLVSPTSDVLSEPVRVRIQGVQPGAEVIVRASFRDHQDSPWNAEARFFADAHGAVDTDADVSLGGTYTGTGAGQLLCSALPVAIRDLSAHKASLGNSARPLISPVLVDISYINIEVSASVVGAKPLVATVRRGYAHDGVVANEVSTAEVVGVYYAPPPNVAQRQAVLVIGGSGGGVSWQQAALLASHGHPALAIAYFGYKDLPPALVDIPLERFSAGVQWLRAKTKSSQVAVVGTSRGSEAAQLLAVHFPEGVAQVVLISPAHLGHGGFGNDVGAARAAWTLRGQSVPFVRFAGDATASDETAFREQGKMPPGFVGTPSFLPFWNSDRAAADWGIPVERANARFLVLAGTADTMWPSWIAADRIAARVSSRRRADLVRVVTYPGAGHAISRVAFANAMSDFTLHPVTKSFASVGGLPAANCAAGFDVWKQILAFIS